MPSPTGVSLRFGALGELAPCFPLGWIVHSVRGGTVELLPDSGRRRDEGGGHSGIPMRFSFFFFFWTGVPFPSYFSLYVLPGPATVVQVPGTCCGTLLKFLPGTVCLIDLGLN